MPEKKCFPSLFVCSLLFPCAYLFSGNFAAFYKNVASGRRFFLKLIESQKKMESVFTRQPRCLALPSGLFLYTACYIYKHGNLFKAITNTVKKITEYGLRDSLHLIMVSVRQLLTGKAGARQRILFMLGKNAQATPFVLNFLKLLKKVGYELEMFAEEGGVSAQTLRALRQIGVRRVFSKHRDDSAIPFLYEFGESYQNVLATIDMITHEIVDCIHSNSRNCNVICLCNDSEELNNINENLFVNLQSVVCHTRRVSIPGLAIEEFPQVCETKANKADDTLLQFLSACTLLSVKYLADFLPARNFPAPVAGTPVISFCLHAYTDEKQSKATAMLLLLEAAKANVPCELIFWGGPVPLWARDAPTPWRHVAGNSAFSSESFRSVESASTGEFVFFIKSGVLLTSGLGEMLSLMRSSPEIGLCGCRMLDMDDSLKEAGAYIQDEKIVMIGCGTSRTAPFYRITRSVPLISTDAFLTKKYASPANEAPGGLVFPQLYGTHIGFASDSEKIAALCGGAEAYVVNFNENSEAEKANAALPGNVTDEEAIMLAAQDRYLPSSAKSRKNRPLNVLYYSPYQSHPASHGNRSTIQHFGRILQQKGCKAHFALLKLDSYSEGDIQAMREAWDGFTLLPYPFQDNSHLGEDIAYDGWYVPGLGEHIAYLCALHDIDLLFCSYVFQSKMLEFVPSHIMKVIDTHDKMSGRYAAQKAQGLKTEFFSCSPEDEGRYLRRADIVVARREDEARYFNDVSKRDTAIVIPHVEPPQFMERRFTQLHSVGLVASANKINLDLVTDFLVTLAAKTCNSPPFSVRIAGQVANMLDDLPQAKRQFFTHPWVELLGFIEDIGEFYASVDLVVSPVLFGTGINVKTVQAMAYGMPLVTTKCGSKGIETGHPMHTCETMGGVVENTLHIHRDIELLEELATCSRERYTTFYNTSLAGFDFLLDAYRTTR